MRDRTNLFQARARTAPAAINKHRGDSSQHNEMPSPNPADADPHLLREWGSGAMPWQLGIISEFAMHLFSHKDGSTMYVFGEATMTGRPRGAGTDSTLVPMLIWGLVLVVVGMAFVMLFV